MISSSLDKPKDLFEVKLEVFTPIATAGYDKDVQHTLDSHRWHEPIRVPSIRGIWRWWLRALFGGIAWDKGRDEIKFALEATKRVLGYVGKEESSRSPLMVTLTRPDTPKSSERISLAKRVPRVSLLQTQREVHFHPPRTYVILKIRSLFPIEQSIEDAAIASLILSTSLGGFGKIARRGFGKLKPIEIGNKNYPKTILDLTSLWKKLFNENLENVRNALKGLCNRTYGLAERAFNEFEKESLIQNNPNRLLPYIPVFSKRRLEKLELNYCQVLLTSASLLVERLRDIIEGNEEIKNDRGIQYYTCRYCTRPGRSFLDSNKPLHLIGLLCRVLAIHPKLNRDRWILGGPRKWGTKTKLKIERRASPIWFTVLGEHGNYQIAATIFLSEGWPQIGRSSVNLLSIFEKLMNLLLECGFQVIWPDE